MQHFMILTLLLVLFGPACNAQDTKSKPKAATPAEEFKALVDDFTKYYEETGKTYRDAKTDAERKKIEAAYQSKRIGFAARLLSLAQTHPGDQAGVDALLMVLSVGTSADKEKALTMLRASAEKGVDKSVQAHAAMGLAGHLKQQLDDADLKPEAAAKLSKEAEDLFDRASKHFTAATDNKGKAIAEMIEKQLFELRNLAIGKVAPDIEGTDSAGKKFKLSDYRGKVVVLDFWAGWCPPCMAMVPHERELVKRLESKPFALIGVNCDADRQEHQKVEKDNKMTWRSIFDGRSGPIAEKWNIQSLPAIFVLDAKGVIRYKGVREKEMDLAVDALLKEQADASKK